MDEPPDEGAQEVALARLHDGHTLVATTQIPPDRHPVAVYLARLAPGSRRSLRHALDVMAGLLTDGRCDARTLDWSMLRYPHTAAVRAALSEKLAPASVNHSLAALRGVLKECWRLGQTGSDDFHRAADLPAVRGTSLPRGRALPMGELRTLFAACAADKRPAGARDAAMLAVLYGAGLRRAELVALDLADYRAEAAELRVLRGKGRKARVCFLPNGTVLALDRWLTVRGDEPGPLFVPINRGNRITIRRLTDQTVLYMLARRAADNGIPNFSPHDLRRTFIGDLLDAGADIATVRQLAGHANVHTTARYDRRGDITRRKAVELLHVPYAEQTLQGQNNRSTPT